MELSRVCKKCFRGFKQVLRRFQKGVKDVLSVFLGSFKGVSATQAEGGLVLDKNKIKTGIISAG